MSKTKVKRCAEAGCRILTAAGRCDKHRAKQELADPPNADVCIAVDARLAHIKADWEDQARKRAAEQLGERREQLFGLRRAGEHIDRAGEQPVFSGRTHV